MKRLKERIPSLIFLSLLIILIIILVLQYIKPKEIAYVKDYNIVVGKAPIVGKALFMNLSLELKLRKEDYPVLIKVVHNGDTVYEDKLYLNYSNILVMPSVIGGCKYDEGVYEVLFITKKDGKERIINVSRIKIDFDYNVEDIKFHFVKVKPLFGKPEWILDKIEVKVRNNADIPMLFLGVLKLEHKILPVDFYAKMFEFCVDIPPKSAKTIEYRKYFDIDTVRLEDIKGKTVKLTVEGFLEKNITVTDDVIVYEEG